MSIRSASRFSFLTLMGTPGKCRRHGGLDPDDIGMHITDGQPFRLGLSKKDRKSLCFEDIIGLAAYELGLYIPA